MADLEKSVSIIFEGVDQMGAGVDSATKRLNSITGAAQGVVDPIASATMGVIKFEAALLAAGVGVTSLAVKMAGDFDGQFREISTLIDASGEDLGQFREDILAYANDSGKSLESITSATYNAISAGVDYTESLGAVSQAEKLAIAGKGDLDSSLTVLVSTLNTYGAGMDEAESYSDLLFQTVRSGQTTLPELSASLAQVTGTANAGGVEFEELSAAIAAVTAGGAPTSQAMTQIRGAIAAIINPTQGALQVAEDLGIQFDATALRSQGLEGVLREVERATGGNVDEMAKLFTNSEALNGVLALTGTGAERFAEKLDDMANSAGATLKAYEEMADEIGLGNQRIANGFRVMMVGIGAPLLDEFGGIQEAIAQIFKAIGASVTGGQLQQFVGLIEGVMQSLEQTLRDVATNLPAALESADLSGFVRGFEVVRDAIGELFNNVDITTVEGLVSVIATLGSGVELLGEFTAGTITAIGPFIEKLAELAAIVLKIDPAWAAMLGVIGGSAVVISTLLSSLASLVAVAVALGGSSGAIPVLTKAVGSFATVLGRIAGPTGAAYLAIEGLSKLKNTLEEFDEFKFNFSDELVKELEKTSGAQRVTTEAGLFSIQKLAEGYVSLSERFGWGDQAEADFSQLSEAAVDAAIKVAASAKQIGGESADDVKRISEAAIEAALAVATSSNEMQAGLERVEAPLFDQLDDMPESLERVRRVFDKEGQGIVVSAEAVGKALFNLQEAYDSGEIDEAKYNKLKTALLGLRDSSNKAATSQEVLSGEVLNSEDAILKARTAVLEQTVALEQLASNERIKKFEVGVNFQIAKMETDAKRFESILNATSSTIASTAQAATSMFGTLDNLSGGDKFRARSAIDKQLKIQKEAANQQGKLIDAQVKNLTARTQALQNGEGLIKIESDGLEPALEMIMWQVLEKVQLRANAESTEFLLGLNGPDEPPASLE